MPIDQAGYWTPPTTVRPSELHAPLPYGVRVQAEFDDCWPFSSTTMPTPGKLLDFYYSDRRNNIDWTDPKGPLSKQMEAYIKYPYNAVMPIGSSGLVGRWERPNGLAAEPVPACLAGAYVPDGKDVVVEFKSRGAVYPSTGVRLRDVFDERPDALEGADDIVLGQLWGKELTFMLAWPGYELELSTITVFTHNGRPLTRFDLGRQITNIYGYFFRNVEKQVILPSEVGFYNIALHQGQNARADSLGVQLLQLHLVRFRSMTSRIWVADIEIV